MAIVEGYDIEDLSNGVIFLSEKVHESLRDLVMHAALFDENNVGFIFGREIENGTVYLEDFMVPKDLIALGKKNKDEEAKEDDCKLYLGLKTKVSKNIIPKFILCSINTHSSIDDSGSIVKSNYRNYMALKGLAQGWNRLYPTACITLLVTIDFTSGKDTLGFYWSDGSKIFRFPVIKVLKTDGEVIKDITEDGTQK